MCMCMQLCDYLLYNTGGDHYTRRVAFKKKKIWFWASTAIKRCPHSAGVYHIQGIAVTIGVPDQPGSGVCVGLGAREEGEEGLK